MIMNNSLINDVDIASENESEQNMLDKWQHVFVAEMKQVDETIVSSTKSDVSLIPQIVGYIISSGGKRIRPILTIVCAKLCGYQDGDRHIKLAAAIEFFHTATLLHDDVVDESVLRRGVKTANEVWGNSVSVLVGDFLLGKAFEFLARDGSIEILRILSEASVIITQGEVKQLVQISDINTSKDTYLDIIASKTAALFVAACQVGAIIAEQDKKKEEALRCYGEFLGVAFQIIDDALDYSAVQEKLGKTIGDDFRESKVTLPVILAYEQSDDEERLFWERVVCGQQNDDDFDRAKEIINKYKILDQSVELAKKYSDKAVECLDMFDECDEKNALIDLLKFSVNRPF